MQPQDNARFNGLIIIPYSRSVRRFTFSRSSASWFWTNSVKLCSQVLRRFKIWRKVAKAVRRWISLIQRDSSASDGLLSVPVVLLWNPTRTISSRSGGRNPASSFAVCRISAMSSSVSSLCVLAAFERKHFEQNQEPQSSIPSLWASRGFPQAAQFLGCCFTRLVLAAGASFASLGDVAGPGDLVEDGLDHVVDGEFPRRF